MRIMHFWWTLQLEGVFKEGKYSNLPITMTWLRAPAIQLTKLLANTAAFCLGCENFYFFLLSVKQSARIRRLLTMLGLFQMHCK